MGIETYLYKCLDEGTERPNSLFYDIFACLKPYGFVEEALYKFFEWNLRMEAMKVSWHNYDAGTRQLTVNFGSIF